MRMRFGVIFELQLDGWVKCFGSFKTGRSVLLGVMSMFFVTVRSSFPVLLAFDFLTFASPDPCAAASKMEYPIYPPISFGENPGTLAASVYTRSVTMDVDSFCGVFGKTSSMYCSKSEFCSYDIRDGAAGCCRTTTSRSSDSRYSDQHITYLTSCPFHSTCSNYDGTFSTLYSEWDTRGVSW